MRKSQDFQSQSLKNKPKLPKIPLHGASPARKDGAPDTPQGIPKKEIFYPWGKIPLNQSKGFQMQHLPLPQVDQTADLKNSRTLTNPSEVLVNEDGDVSDGTTFRDHMSYRRRQMEELKKKQEEEEKKRQEELEKRM